MEEIKSSEINQQSEMKYILVSAHVDNDEDKIITSLFSNYYENENKIFLNFALEIIVTIKLNEHALDYMYENIEHNSNHELTFYEQISIGSIKNKIHIIKKALMKETNQRNSWILLCQSLAYYSKIIGVRKQSNSELKIHKITIVPHGILDSFKSIINKQFPKIETIEELCQSLCLFSNNEIIKWLKEGKSKFKSQYFNYLSILYKKINNPNYKKIYYTSHYLYINNPGEINLIERDEPLASMIYKELFQLTKELKFQKGTSIKYLALELERLFEKNNMMLTINQQKLLEEKVEFLNGKPFQDVTLQKKMGNKSELIRQIKKLILRYEPINNEYEINLWTTMFFIEDCKLTYESIRKAA